MKGEGNEARREMKETKGQTVSGPLTFYPRLSPLGPVSDRVPLFSSRDGVLADQRGA